MHQNSEWLAAYRVGDREALERAYRAYARSVERYLNAVARARGKNQTACVALIPDLVQEVFIRAFSADARQAYDGQSDYAHYLAAVARNCFIDLMRARRREVLTLPEDLPFDIETAPEPENWCDERTLQVVEAYLGGLSQILRHVYESRFVRGLSQINTAASLGITRRAVRTGERRLRAGLRKGLIRAGIPLQYLAPVDRVLPAGPPSGPLVTGSRGSI